MSSVSPTPAETSLISQIFTIADPQGLGIITSDAAVQILSGSNLPTSVLGEIWAIADQENNGFLTRKGAGIAVRLIGHAQKGENVNEELLAKPGPLAVIEGISPKLTSSTTSATSLPTSLNSIVQVPSLTQEDKTKFLKLFIGCGPVNGLLSGEKARDVFVKSRLPYEKLSQIWNLADTKARGALDATDFTLGMHFIQACMSSPSFSLPDTLPRWLYEQASQSLDQPIITSHVTGASSNGLSSPLQSSFRLPQQMTGGSATFTPSLPAQPSSNQIVGSPSASSTFFSKLEPTKPSQSSLWEITPEAKAFSDKIFDGLDVAHRGFIEGDIAVPFMLKSNLSQVDLAQIWDLSDLNNDGQLTREGLAVAFHLIKIRKAGNELPASLPESLLRSIKPATQIDLLEDIFAEPPVVPQQTGGQLPTASRPILPTLEDAPTNGAPAGLSSLASSTSFEVVTTEDTKELDVFGENVQSESTPAPISFDDEISAFFTPPPQTVSPTINETTQAALLPKDEPEDFSNVASKPDESGLLDAQDDLLSPLNEIEESESDSSNSDDEVPEVASSKEVVSLKEVASPEEPYVNGAPPAITLETTAIQAPVGDSDNKVKESITADLQEEKPQSPLASGNSSPRRSRSPLSARSTSPHSVTAASPSDPFGGSVFVQTPLEPPPADIVPPTIETVLEPAPPAEANTTMSSINDFDEAFGTLSAAKEQPVFQFDSAFDDNFDFTSVTGNDVPNVSSVQGTNSVQTPVPSASPFPPVSSPLPSSPAPFEPIVKAPAPATPTAQSTSPFYGATSNGSPPTKAENAGVSFEDAFGFGLANSQNGTSQPAFSSVPNSLSSRQPTSPRSLAEFNAAAGNSSIAISTPPRQRSTSPPPIRSISPQSRSSSVLPPRTSSPPPRTSSPRLRVLSGSKGEGKPEGGSKHKLSIRFPFGRKDKSKDKEEKKNHPSIPPVPSGPSAAQNTLSPLAEIPLSGAVTPAVEDDVDQVKQLSSMGFSRTQSIAALEAHGYDLQRALNSLLGAA
ncbi:hypothetical protein M422DRAFT_36793 [Sphaerobolus stellatus SS14]|uniref:Unplaced genomic scaffold SPHSTscaffold_198, whole genome shotgun sequence n=1 Tax=Sphaerobolus stellatus (strain SS14) TaxID=990650 RepID=A0A0C9UX20_SPHS4|nr:hypothetical protein M422DRAFT_36793 [Sphaerobolus stellatus SS14]